MPPLRQSVLPTLFCVLSCIINVAQKNQIMRIVMSLQKQIIMIHGFVLGLEAVASQLELSRSHKTSWIITIVGRWRHANETCRDKSRVWKPEGILEKSVCADFTVEILGQKSIIVWDQAFNFELNVFKDGLKAKDTCFNWSVENQTTCVHT